MQPTGFLARQLRTLDCMLRRWCLVLLEARADPRMAVVAVLFVAIFRFVVELNVRGTTSLRPEVLYHALLDSLVFYAAAYFIFTAILKSLLPGRPPGIPAVVSLGLLTGIAPPVLEALIPALGGEYYDYMFDWQLAFHDPSFQPLSETITVWAIIALTGAFVGVVSGSVLRASAAAALAWGGLVWLGVVVPSLLFHGKVRDLLADRWQMSAVFLVTAAVLFHGSRLPAHAPSLRRMNHALPFGALAFCGAAFGRFDAVETSWRVAVILYLCLVLLIHNDYYDRAEDARAGRPASTDASDVLASTALATLLLFTISRFAPMVAMSASSMLLLGFAYHHPAFRLKENFCLSYKVEGGWALSAFCTGVSGPALFATDRSLTWPALLVFGGGALFSIAKDWKDVASDRAARIPTLYVQLARTPDEETRVHGRIVVAVGCGMAAAVLLAWYAYGFNFWLPVLLAASVPVLGALQGISKRHQAVEVFLLLLGVWLFLAGLFIREAVS
jgi:hypothetical protein